MEALVTKEILMTILKKTLDLHFTRPYKFLLRKINPMKIRRFLYGLLEMEEVMQIKELIIQAQKSLEDLLILLKN